MFKPKNPSNDKTKSGNNKEESQTIPLKEGWEKINNNGVQPFFERVEKVDNEEAFETTSIPQQQYIVTYDTIFTMCIQREPYNYSSPLYQKHSEALTLYYKEKFTPALQKAKDQHGLVFLKEWVKRWRCAKWAVDGMTRMFMYLDRFHVPNSEDLLSTGEQGYTLFRKEVFDQFKETARNAILKCIQNEREGEEQDRDLLRDAILVFVELGNKLKKVELQIYKDDFHRVLLIQTREYYKQKSRVWMDQLSCPEYLIQCEKCVLAEQDERLASYIDKFSTEGLMLATREELLKVHEEELLQKETGINRMLERTIGADTEVAKEDLSRLYRLYQNVATGLPSISEAMKNYICEIGNGFIQKSKEAKTASGKANKADKGDKDEEDGGGGGGGDADNTKGGQNDDETKQTGKDDDENKGGGSGGATSDHELIINLINLHERFLSIVRTQFQQDGIFQKALKEAFEDFINREYYTSALLARYANDILRKGTKLAITDLERTMDHVVMIYGYIRDKDIFERDYQTYLASRLLQDLSESEQSERSMIGKLKTEAGYHWTSKLEDMFKDIQRSKELQSEFNKTYGDQFDVELSVSVCTTGAWPTSSIHPIKKPQDIVGVSERFTQYYLNKYSGRRLNFQMDKGKAEVNVLFSPKVKKILVISTYQMIILLLFNNKATLTFGEIVEETGIPREDCMAHLLSMAHPKVKVLRKAPNTKDCNDDHKFQINPKYTNPRAKVSIPVINIQSTTATSQEQESADMEAIVRQRKYQMDAAIVRIMKARKTLKHPDLVGEVVKQLRGRFTPKPVDIKKRIANLIELEYLERDEKDRQTYHYKQ